MIQRRFQYQQDVELDKKITDELWIEEEEVVAWPRYYPGICLDSLDKCRNTTVTIAGVPTEIQTKQIPNNILQFYL